MLDNGDCQFCGAPLNRGVSQCVDLFGNISQKISHKDGIKYGTIFLCVDAHALQHIEKLSVVPEKRQNGYGKMLIDFAPCTAAATGLPVTESRKVFVIKTGTEPMETAKRILHLG